MAITEGVTKSRKQTNRLRRTLVEDSTLIQAEFPSKLNIYEALLCNGAQYAPYVLNEIREVFGKMLATGATSLWETAGGGEAFSRAGSLCHGWSSVLCYVAAAHVLGVRPLGPGFKTFTVAPLTGDLLSANGEVPTPSGTIHIAWQQSEKTFRLRLRHPKSLKPVLSLPKAKKIEMV